MKHIKLPGNEFLLIKLMQPLTVNTEVYPGDPKPGMEIFCSIKDTGYEHYVHKIGDHNFQPHSDAPKHQNPDMIESDIEFFNEDHFFNSCLMIDLTGAEDAEVHQGIKYLRKIKKMHLFKYEKQLKKKGAVILRTGYDKWIEKNLPHKIKLLPYISKEAADYIHQTENIRTIAIDTLSVDPPGSHYVHNRLKKKYIVESIVNLSEIPPESAEDFLLQVCPVEIKGATGCPVCAYAWIKQ